MDCGGWGRWKPDVDVAEWCGVLPQEFSSLPEWVQKRMGCSMRGMGADGWRLWRSEQRVLDWPEETGQDCWHTG